MLTLSLPSVARATVQPPSTGPTTSSSGTNTSLKNTSLKSEAPDVSFRGRTSTPSACMSITIIVMPSCLGTSGFVRTVANPMPATCAPLVHTFWPLTSQPPSTRVALVLTPAASEPASGSLKSWHQMTSWFSAGVHPAIDLVLGGVLDDREDVPRRDPVGRAGDAGLGELLLDHELLDRAGGAPVGLGPVRHHVAGLDQSGPLLLGRQILDALRERADLVADGVGLGRQLDGLLAGDAAAGDVGEFSCGARRRRGSGAAWWRAACRGAHRAPT